MAATRLRARLCTFYDVVAPVYGFWSGLFESRAARRAYRTAGFCGGERVLEVAVGGGEFLTQLAKTPGLKQCTGVDLSAPMLARACRRLEAGGIVPAYLCRADAMALPFDDRVFDILFNLYMMDLLLMEDVPVVLREFARVLAPGGRLIVLSMAQQMRMLNEVWMWLYRRSPVLTGGCRPLPVAELLAQNGWKINLRETISQAGFRSELVVGQFMPESGQ